MTEYWRYKTVKIECSFFNLVKELNNLGSTGWEVINIINIDAPDYTPIKLKNPKIFTICMKKQTN